MIERRRIVEKWRLGGCCALATLIRVEGSSYRRTGARLLIAADGSYVGGISGGCLEAEVIRKAQWMVRNGAVVERYSTLFDDTADIPYGLGCGGTVDVLFESAETPEFEELMRAMERSLEVAQMVVTYLPTATSPLRREVLDEGIEVKESDSVVVERLGVPQRLVLLGAGDDAQPMLQFASMLGWNVTVADTRVQWATRVRFPAAQRVLAGPEATMLEVSTEDAVVLMTHSYEQDRDWLANVLPKRPRYVGLLGARHRSALLLSEVAPTIGWTIDQVCESVFAPIGLDLGGDGAEAIALATIAEIHGCLEGKLGAPRRMTPQIVAAQLEAGDARRYTEAHCAL